MPKTSGTRRQKANELLKLSIQGPSWGLRIPKEHRNQAEEEYRLWASSWLTPLIVELIPELRKKNEVKKDRCDELSGV